MGNYILIPLGKDAKDGFTSVDSEFEHLATERWRKTHYGYAIRSRDKMLLHRLVMEVKRGKQIDHISGDRLDNRKTNLRVCTQAENSRNQSLKVNNTSGYKGVSFRKDIGKYEVKVKVNYKKYYFGCYKSLEEAAKAYDRAATVLHGKYARLNHA